MFLEQILFIYSSIMMNYTLINAPDDARLSFVRELYESAFPLEERRDWEQLLVMLVRVPEMKLEVITTADKIVGFIISWMFGEWCFIEHFAIDPVHRGLKYGEKVMYDFTQGGKVLLEVEPPDSTDAVRRIGFYERLGMNVLPLEYRQPCYRNAGVSYRLLLMSNVAKQDDTVLNSLIEQVVQQVYGLS